MPRPPRAPRPVGRTYQLKSEHFALLKELDRLFPARAPLVDFARIAAGAESVETVAIQLYAALRANFEQPVFVAFCHVNAERLLDAIGWILERGAYPLSRDELLADLYVRLYEHLRELQRPTSLGSSWRVPFQWHEPAGEWTLFDMLVAGAEALVREQIDFLAACELPLPGLPIPELEPGDGPLERAQSVITAKGIRIPGKTARHWVAHALLRLPEEERRVLYLREKLGLTFEQVAQKMGMRPFEAVALAKRSVLDLQDRILRTVLAFHVDLPASTDAVSDESSGPLPPIRPGPGSGRPTRPPAQHDPEFGRLLSLRPRRKDAPRKDEDEGEVDS